MQMLNQFEPPFGRYVTLFVSFHEVVRIAETVKTKTIFRLQTKVQVTRCES